MNTKETIKIMAVLKTAYPRFYVNQTDEEKKQALDLWQIMFADKDYLLVSKAVKSLIATNKYPPTIADVNEQINAITNPHEMTEVEAWGLVRKAVCNSGYNSVTEFNKLPENIQCVVGSPEMLKSWALADIDELDTVIASNFQRSFRAKQSEIKRYMAMPQDVKDFMLEIADKMPRLESSNNGT